jgi:hypothetical protein
MHANMLGETSHTYAHVFKHTVHMHAQTNTRSNCIRGPAAAQCAENVAHCPFLLLHMHRPNLAKERMEGQGRGIGGVASVLLEFKNEKIAHTISRCVHQDILAHWTQG